MHMVSPELAFESAIRTGAMTDTLASDPESAENFMYMHSSHEGWREYDWFKNIDTRTYRKVYRPQGS